MSNLYFIAITICLFAAGFHVWAKEWARAVVCFGCFLVVLLECFSTHF